MLVEEEEMVMEQQDAKAIEVKFSMSGWSSYYPRVSSLEIFQCALF